MLGIHFVSHVPFTQVLDAVLSHILTKQLYWFISEYITLSDNNQIEKRLYSSDELQFVFRANDNATVDYACLFATTHKDIADFPQTVKDYLESAFSAVVVCTDSVEFDFYCKDIEVLYVVRSFLVSSQICSPEKINILTSKTDDRTGFYW